SALSAITTGDVSTLKTFLEGPLSENFWVKTKICSMFPRDDSCDDDEGYNPQFDPFTQFNILDWAAFYLGIVESRTDLANQASLDVHKQREILLILHQSYAAYLQTQTPDQKADLQFKAVTKLTNVLISLHFYSCEECGGKNWQEQQAKEIQQLVLTILEA